MKARVIGEKLREFARLYPVVTLTGPRQSGKTTLCRALFPEKEYVNLEDAEQRLIARTDPKGFLGRFARDVVINEIQRVPDLVSAIQVDVDAHKRPGRYILTGSQNLLLMKSVSQSLSGRTALATLLPFSLGELYGKRPPALEDVIWRGFYPAIHDQKLSPAHTLAFYFATYVERDIRDLLNVKDLGRFERFVRLCAGRTGQILNCASLAVDAGIAVSTAQEWLSVLETCYVVSLLKPWSANINKRLVKAPKLYFLDTGREYARLFGRDPAGGASRGGMQAGRHGRGVAARAGRRDAARQGCVGRARHAAGGRAGDGSAEGFGGCGGAGHGRAVSGDVRRRVEGVVPGAGCDGSHERVLWPH